MITVQDLYNIVGNRISNEIQKQIIRSSFPPNIAEQLCAAIDGQEKAEHIKRILQEWNEYQMRQIQVIQQFLGQYYR